MCSELDDRFESGHYKEREMAIYRLTMQVEAVFYVEAQTPEEASRKLYAMPWNAADELDVLNQWVERETADFNWEVLPDIYPPSLPEEETAYDARGVYCREP